MYNKAILNDYGFGHKTIEGISLKLNKSTSQAEAFHLSMKVACLDWTDPIISFVNDIVDKRLFELAEANEKGIYFKVAYKKPGKDREFSKCFVCLNKERAVELMKIYEPSAEIINIEELFHNVETYVDKNAKESIISNPF